MSVCAAFARVLSAGRRQFNTRVEEARRRAPGFDAAVFSDFLRDGVDGVIVAVEETAPARTMAVALAAYDIALSLCVHGLAGSSARTSLLNEAWSRLFPRLAARIAEQPQDVLGALSNAAVHLVSVDGARGDEWLGWMAELGPQAENTAQLLDLGKVLAWRCGLAHFRQGALAAVDELPASLQLAALGAPTDGSWPALRAALAADPWASAQPRRRHGWRVGAFTGFGGRFAQPPELRVAADGFLVRSGTRHFLAVADACGAVLLPASAEEYATGAPPSGGSLQLRGDHLVLANREVPLDHALDLPLEGLTVATDAHTAAIASPWTHEIRLLPLK